MTRYDSIFSTKNCGRESTGEQTDFLRFVAECDLWRAFASKVHTTLTASTWRTRQRWATDGRRTRRVRTAAAPPRLSRIAPLIDPLRQRPFERLQDRHQSNIKVIKEGGSKDKKEKGGEDVNHLLFSSSRLELEREVALSAVYDGRTRIRDQCLFVTRENNGCETYILSISITRANGVNVSGLVNQCTQMK